MAVKKYFIKSGKDTNLGPFEFQKIMSMVSDHELDPNDMLYLAESDQWIKIQDHPEYSVSNTQVDTKTITKEFYEVQKSMAPGDSNSWFILRKGEKMGPLSYESLVKMLQKKEAFEFEFIWKQGMESWKRIAEIPEFSASHIAQLRKVRGAKKADIFVERSSDRIKYKCEILTHNNKIFWPGHTVELSEGGISAIVQNSLLMPGHNLYVHFRPTGDQPSFNALCEVVSKKFEKNIRDRHAPLIYGLKFINIPKQDKELIKKILSDAA